jgi:hypothetical protein
VLEGDRVAAFQDQPFIDDVEHLQEGHMLVDVSRLIRDELTAVGRVGLSPDVQG